MVIMQSEEDWDDDEDWDDYDDDGSSSFLDMELATKMKLAGAIGIVILLIMSSMIFTNFGFYSGAGTISVLIDVEEALNPEDKTLNAFILATSPTFGMLTSEGDYTISISGSSVYSGNFKLNDEGRGSIAVEYSNFFTVNGIYTLTVDIKGTSDSDTVDLQKIADSVRGEVPVFDGSYPLSKDDNLLINLQFKTSDQFSDYISPWVTGTIKIFHAEEVFDDGEGEEYWNDDGNRDFMEVETILFTVEGASINWQYSSGSTDNGVSLWLDPSEFYTEGSGDYAITIEFSNDLGEDDSIKNGQTFWKWFHICKTKANGYCDGND